MKRSITRVIMLVTTATVIALGAPLAVVVQRSFYDNAVVRLQRRAALAAGEVTLPLDPAAVSNALSEPDGSPDVTVYDAQGQRIAGAGPLTGDTAVQQALDGLPVATVIGAAVVVATPIDDRNAEHVAGVVRVTIARPTIWRQTLRAWGLMAAVATAALVGAWLAARRQSNTLARPVAALAETAHRIGAGQLPAPPHPSGLDEIDDVARVLHASSTRAAELLARERAFSSDVSHQLRTPLTRLRLTIEQLTRRDDTSQPAADALREIDHVEATIEYLLTLGRGGPRRGAGVDAASVTVAARQRWQPAVRRDHRDITVDVDGHLDPIAATPAALDQVLDVLVDNALRHGRGPIVLRARRALGAVAIEIGDHGATGTTDITQLARRQHHPGHGIGRALARTLIGADGGRLDLVGSNPTTFQIIYPIADDTDARAQ